MSDRDLVSPEGVDEGSAQGTAEGGPAGAAPAASPGPRSASVPEPSPPAEEGATDLLGEPPRGAAPDDAQEAEPVDMESAESRSARAERGTGQQYQVGEG